jgi:hypothetical protein
MFHALDPWAVRVKVCPAYSLFPLRLHEQMGHAIQWGRRGGDHNYTGASKVAGQPLGYHSSGPCTISPCVDMVVCRTGVPWSELPKWRCTRRLCCHRRWGCGVGVWISAWGKLGVKMKYQKSLISQTGAAIGISKWDILGWANIVGMSPPPLIDIIPSHKGVFDAPWVTLYIFLFSGIRDGNK